MHTSKENSEVPRENQKAAKQLVKKAFVKAISNGVKQVISRLKHSGERAAQNEYHQDIQEAPSVPGVFYRHTHDEIGEPSTHSVTFYFRRPSKDAMDPVGHLWVTFNDESGNEKLSYVAKSFAGKPNPKMLKILAGCDDEVTPGKLVARDKNGKFENSAYAADSAITVFLHDSPDATAAQKMEMLKTLADLIRSQEKYNLYDYNCDANIKEIADAIKSMEYTSTTEIRDINGKKVYFVSSQETDFTNQITAAIDEAGNSEASALIGKGRDIQTIREAKRDAKILKTRPQGLELAT